MSQDLVTNGQLLRNVIGALRQVLEERPDGCLESKLWHGVEVCFVERGLFNDAIDIMINAGWATRRFGRLFAGSAPKPQLGMR